MPMPVLIVVPTMAPPVVTEKAPPPTVRLLPVTSRPLFASTLPFRVLGQVREQVRALGGHATLFRGGDRTAGVFHPLDPVMDTLQTRLKHAFDPAGIFAPGRPHDGR